MKKMLQNFAVFCQCYL